MGVSYLFKLALIASVCVGLGFSVSIETRPDKITASMTESAIIACVGDDVGGEVKSVESMEITKDGKDLIALVRPCSQSDCTLKSSSDIEVDGIIGAVPSQSVIKVTIPNPTANDTGSYACTMNYVDQSDLIKEDKVETMMVVEELTAESLQPSLDNLTKRVEMLEAQAGGAGSAGAFQNPECYSAFLVTNKKHYRAVRSKALILPDVVMMKGDGYDVKSGVFTAPCSGLYSFHLTVALSGKMSAAIVQLKKNSDIVLRVYAADKSYDDQSAASTALFLEKGETVSSFVEAITGSRIFDDNGYTLFSGYLTMRLE